MDFKYLHRVSYAETDQMGFMHHSNYLGMYENARWESFRELGISYKYVENNNIIMPVIDVQLHFIKPAFYDDYLSVTTQIKEIKGPKMEFYYTTLNSSNKIINTATVVVACVNKTNKKPIRFPEFILEKLLVCI